MALFVLYHNERFIIDHTDPSWTYYFPVRWLLFPHGLAGTVALFLGASQFSTRLRQRHARLHRILGRCYVTGVVIAAPMGIYITIRHNALPTRIAVITTALLEPIRTARDQADLRGRLLELNLAYQFERAGFHPEVCAKQGGTGDMDFRFAVSVDEVFLETKLLRQDEATTTQINSQLAASNNFGVARSDDTEDIARLQRNLIQKANPRKFDAVPKANWINLVGIDVSELQLGMVDVGDCLLAADGNPVATAHCHDSVRRPNVVEVFERLSSMTPGQTKWASELDALVGSAVHPREYIHGAVFLFREPEDTAALVYKLTAAIVWNSALVTHAIARDLAPALHQIVPHLMPRK